MKNITPKQIVTYTLAFIAAILAIIFGVNIAKPFLFSDPKITGSEADIAKATAISNIVVDKSKLPKGEAYYKTIADSIHKMCLGNFTFFAPTLTEFTTVKSMLNTLMPSELNQVAKDFGTRQEVNFLISYGRTYTLIEALQFKFKIGSDYSKQLQAIFKNTKLW